MRVCPIALIALSPVVTVVTGCINPLLAVSKFVTVALELPVKVLSTFKVPLKELLAVPKNPLEAVSVLLMVALELPVKSFVTVALELAVSRLLIVALLDPVRSNEDVTLLDPVMVLVAVKVPATVAFEEAARVSSNAILPSMFTLP